MSFSGISGDLASASGTGGSRREESCGGGAGVWDTASDRGCLDEAVQEGRGDDVPGEASGSSTGRSTEREAGTRDLSDDRGPLSGSVEVARVPVDAGSGLGAD